VELNTVDSKVKQQLEKIINELLKVFINVDYEVEYSNIDKIDYAHLYLSSIMSNADILAINNLSETMNFYFTIISSKEKVNRKNRNSKIEIYLKDNKKSSTK